jgi:chromosome segregation ATPase
MKGEANRSAKHADTLKARIAELEAQNAELRQSERTLAQQRDRAHENLARVTAMNVELRRALERGKDMERVTKLHLDEPCPHIPKEITAPFHCTSRRKSRRHSTARPACWSI